MKHSSLGSPKHSIWIIFLKSNAGEGEGEGEERLEKSVLPSEFELISSVT